MNNIYNVTGQLLISTTEDMPLEAKKYILSIHPLKIMLPNCPWVDGCSITDLFYHYLDVDINWINIRLLCCQTNSQAKTLNLVYGGVIPFDTEIKHGYWIEFNLQANDIALTNEIISLMRNL